MADEEDEQAEALGEQGEEAKPEEEPDKEEPREEQPVQEQPPKQEAPPPSDKKKRIQVDLNASLKDTADGIHHYLSALPVVPEEPRPYTPILYTFRLKTNKNKNTQLKHITTKPPPFYLQFDHTIAVIWILFNKESNRDNLGINQLQWAFHFLNSIYNSEGVHPRDVQLCIDTIQDYLIDEYADMSEESVIYGSKASGDPRGAAVDLKQKDVNLPFSINYSQMIEKAPAFTVDVDDTETDVIDHHLLEELENVKKVAGIESIDLTKIVSKDQVMNILNDWKNEQIGKIQEELKMLFVVEDMMKNSDEQNFEGYTDEKQFETIFKRNQENKGSTENKA